MLSRGIFCFIPRNVLEKHPENLCAVRGSFVRWSTMLEHPCPGLGFTPACLSSSNTKMEFHVLKIRAVWGTRFLHLFFATSDLERNIRFHFASDCFATKIVKEKKYFCVVGGFTFTYRALCCIILTVWRPPLSTSHNKIYAWSQGLRECALGTENFNYATGNSGVYMVEVGGHHKALLTFRKQKQQQQQKQTNNPPTPPAWVRIRFVQERVPIRGKL